MAGRVLVRAAELEQLRHGLAGAHGVAGLADLDSMARLSGRARASYRAILAQGMRGAAHRHVYAANLGVRADAYLGCGGFPARGHGEERHLRQPTDLRVRTSARTNGRAQGGLAELLAQLQESG